LLLKQLSLDEESRNNQLFWGNYEIDRQLYLKLYEWIFKFIKISEASNLTILVEGVIDSKTATNFIYGLEELKMSVLEITKVLGVSDPYKADIFVCPEKTQA
jgi:hypothetical protein